MIYENIVEGKFIARPNRFVATVEINGKEEQVHVKNTGRCKELLLPGSTVYLEDFENRMGTRKMRYSMIGVEKKVSGGCIMINMDSQAPNKVVEEALNDGTISLPEMGKLSRIKRESNFGNSRFDFYLEDISGQKAYVEVKGVTLEDDGLARFPDAPTQRGVKHINELVKAREAGYKAYLLFLVQMNNIEYVLPNWVTHPGFGEAIEAAMEKGLNVVAYNCIVERDMLKANEPILFKLR